ncbi:MAG: roadblock/LC7 domain-containing protein, partial [Desulfurococcales archaeon]|nr:roadblock/LC7 domain-containing protein [Desulfurococcales archaeon]
MSREEHEDLNKIQSFLSNLDGIQVFVISRDGFPIIFGRELDQESAEAYTALSVDLILASQEALKDINEHGSKNIIVELDKNIVINVHQLNSILLTIKGDRRIVPITDKNILNY